MSGVTELLSGDDDPMSTFRYLKTAEDQLKSIDDDLKPVDNELLSCCKALLSVDDIHKPFYGPLKSSAGPF